MKVASWSLSPQTIAVLARRHQSAGKPIHCRRKLVAPKGELSHEVEITPSYHGIMVKREFLLEIEDPNTALFFSNNLIIDLLLETGSGKFFFTLQEGQNRFYNGQELRPPYLVDVPHPNVRSIRDFYQKGMVQSCGAALTAALQFVLEKDQGAKVIPLRGRESDPLEEFRPALAELIQQIMRSAGIED